MQLSDDRLFRILENQGYRELVSAHLFTAGVPFAPSLDDKHMLAEHAQEELSHFEAVSALYEKIAGRSLFDIAAERAKSMPVPTSWLEAAIAGYLVDRAASVQLAEYKKLEDTRLAGVVQHILEHEHEHQSAAETALVDQCGGGRASPERAAEHVARWYPIALAVLDDLDTARVRKAFAESVRATLSSCGLSLPAGE